MKRYWPWIVLGGIAWLSLWVPKSSAKGSPTYGPRPAPTPPSSPVSLPPGVSAAQANSLSSQFSRMVTGKAPLGGTP
jgi:hypothetical protein